MFSDFEGYAHVAFLLGAHTDRHHQTCRYLWKLTRSPRLWEGFLKELRLPLPVLRPTYSMEDEEENAVSSEIERLVARAASLNSNFRSSSPTVLSVNRLPPVPRSGISKFDRVKLLPGGRHMLAAFSDDSGHGLVLYDLDSPKHPRHLLACPYLETE